MKRLEEEGRNSRKRGVRQREKGIVLACLKLVCDYMHLDAVFTHSAPRGGIEQAATKAPQTTTAAWIHGGNAQATTARRFCVLPVPRALALESSKKLRGDSNKDPLLFKYVYAWSSDFHQSIASKTDSSGSFLSSCEFFL